MRTNNLYLQEMNYTEKAEIIDFHDPNLKYFDKWMRKMNLSEGTIRIYMFVIKDFYKRHNSISKLSLLAYREYMIENYSPNTVNLRINALNKYLDFIKKKSLAIKSVKVQQKNFTENVISNEDYKYFVRRLKKDKHMTMYFAVKFMACTGCRVGELIKFRYEDIEKGYKDIYSKAKHRRIYIPRRLQLEALKWLENEKITYGYIFLNKNGIQISTRGIGKELKEYAAQYKSIPIETVYPHSFRHRFAINFLEKTKDLVLLADLLGHSNIETTRVYLKLPTSKIRDTINSAVTW